jgi:hypothetical protein
LAAQFRLDILEPRCSEWVQPVWFHCWINPLIENEYQRIARTGDTDNTRNTANTTTTGDTTTTGCSGDTLRLRKNAGWTG